MDLLRAIRPHPKVDMLLSAERDAIVSECAGVHLSALGLAEVGPRTWVDGRSPPARRVFQFVLLKGASFKANWGYSLDFVPHISGRTIRWHRSDKTARLDVVVDPKENKDFSYLHGAKHLRDDLNKRLPSMIERAQGDWARSGTWPDMLRIVEEIRQNKTNAFHFSYVQLPLAYAFLSAKAGDIATAERELEAYWHPMLNDELRAKLLEHAHSLAAAS